MDAARIGGRLHDRPHVEATIRDLQQENLLLVLPVVALAGLLLILAEDHFPQPVQITWPGLTLFVLPLFVYALRAVSYRVSVWALVGGCVVAIWLVAWWAGIDVAIHFLAVPAGLAALLLNVLAGALTAATISSLLLLMPSQLLPAEHALRLATVLGTWSTVGLIWLTLRPVVTTLHWSWASYEQSRRLLERARDYQVRLKQTVEDLAHANLQLTRLNHVAQGLRQAAEEARRAKEQFVTTVSHELRTPLNMIVGFSEMIVRAPQVYGDSIPPALLADLAVVLRNSQHLSSLIDDVLDLSQIEAGRMALTRERVRLQEVIEAAVTAVRPLYESKGLHLKTELSGDVPAVWCDRTRIREVVLNLLSNAGRFTERGGVDVQLGRDGDVAAVSISDTGPGIPANQIDKVFRPFQQLDGSTRRRHGGSGLGLSISKGFVELHGGSMQLASQEGHGTVVTFRLPIDPPALLDSDMTRWLSPEWEYVQRTRPSLAPAAVIRPRYVVVEEGATLLRVLNRYLEGAETVAVDSIAAAVEDLARVPASALLVNTPTVGEALQRLNESAPLPYGTPALVCSLPGTGGAIDTLGVAEYLVKPISRDALLSTLDRLRLGGKNLLVVDDEPEAIQLYRRMLGSVEPGYSVLGATDGYQALSILRQQHVDAVLLDLIMPGMDGFRLLETKNQDPSLSRIPVVVTSARDPAGQPIVAGSVAATRAGGLSLPQLLACIQSVSSILSTPGLSADPAPAGTGPG